MVRYRETRKVSKNAVVVLLSRKKQESNASNEMERVRQEMARLTRLPKEKRKRKVAPRKKSTGTSYNAHHPSHPIISCFSGATRLKSLALQALLARLTAADRLPPHGAIGSSSLLLLGRVRRRAPGTHRPRTSDATARTTDVDHAGRSQLRGSRRLGRGELWLCWLVMFQLMFGFG